MNADNKSVILAAPVTLLLVKIRSFHIRLYIVVANILKYYTHHYFEIMLLALIFNELRNIYYYIMHLKTFQELYFNIIGFLYNLCNLFYGFKDITLWSPQAS